MFTHWNRYKMSSLQTPFLNTLSWFKIFVIWFKFHWTLFPGQITKIMSSDNGLTSNRRHAIICTNDDQIYWTIYTSLGLNVLKTPSKFGRDDWWIICDFFLVCRSSSGGLYRGRWPHRSRRQPCRGHALWQASPDRAPLQTAGHVCLLWKPPSLLLL